MKFIRSVPWLLLGLAILSLAAAEPKILVNVDQRGLAMQGYDPVGYHTQGKALRGNPELAARYQGATYHFASEENRRRFDQDPERYVPRFGGFCGYGLSKGYLAPVSCEAFQMINGRLILQYNQGAVQMFAKDLEQNLAKAEANWPGLVEKHGK